MSTKKSNKKANRRIVIYTLILIAIIIGVFLTLPNYVVQIVNMYQEKQNLKENLSSLKDDQEELETEVAQLSDNAYIARIARQKYLFSKDGEIIVKVGTTYDDPLTTSKTSFSLDEYYKYGIIAAGGIVLILIIVKIKHKKHKTRRK